jgi:hypothetical protein
MELHLNFLGKAELCNLKVFSLVMLNKVVCLLALVLQVTANYVNKLLMIITTDKNIIKNETNRPCAN